MTFELAVCAEMVFTDLDIVKRARRISELGFAVEIWSFSDKDLDALAATGARFSSMTGYLHGDLYDPDGAREVVRTAQQAVKAAAVLGVPRLVVHPGELVDGHQHAGVRPLQDVSQLVGAVARVEPDDRCSQSGRGGRQHRKQGDG